jgi:hypothetical protein
MFVWVSVFAQFQPTGHSGRLALSSLGLSLAVVMVCDLNLHDQYDVLQTAIM